MFYFLWAEGGGVASRLFVRPLGRVAFLLCAPALHRVHSRGRSLIRGEMGVSSRRLVLRLVSGQAKLNRLFFFVPP